MVAGDKNNSADHRGRSWLKKEKNKLDWLHVIEKIGGLDQKDWVQALPPPFIYSKFLGKFLKILFLQFSSPWEG